jgi:hypothetical protein
MTQETLGEVVRITMRYLGMYLMTRGAVDPGFEGLFGDPVIVGLVTAGIAEAVFAFKKWRAGK